MAFCCKGRGGSGFLVLERNTTRIESGIPLRDSLIGFMQNFCTCDDLLNAKLDAFGNTVGANNQTCSDGARISAIAGVPSRSP